MSTYQDLDSYSDGDDTDRPPSAYQLWQRAYDDPDSNDFIPFNERD